MALGTIILSYTKRTQLLYILIAFCILQSILGAAVFGQSLYMFLQVAPIIKSESSEIRFAFATTGIFGTNLMTHWLFGIMVCRKCYYHARRRSTSSQFAIWCFIGSQTALYFVVIVLLARKLNRQIERSMKNSLQSYMKNYLRNADMKYSMDYLQFSQKCCGIYSYQDWHKISWLSVYEVNKDAEAVKNKTEDGVMHLPVIPWSCCRVDFPSQCFHDALQQPGYAHLWKDEDSIVESSVNTNGCLEIVSKPVEFSINLVTALMSVITVLHVIIFCLMKILYTSCRNVFLLEDHKGKSPGWVFGRGDFGYMMGKTLHEIMEGVDQKGSEQQVSQKPIKEKENKLLKRIMRKRKKSDHLIDKEKQKRDTPETERLLNNK
ncbi:peripherin-2 [Aethina tumida]|uniref:peripherin-2 n=1 Tax=Aethina tumida TaxID=116153 RepID=UPI00096AFC10|nr:peripherin-2 [Aethina tumida]